MARERASLGVPVVCSASSVDVKALVDVMLVTAVFVMKPDLDI
jgi:hypothetical protein|tara:strand:+ start:524 stop:652 length:129 start_codon:yes stop_codon:yes gene_type:complete